MKTISVVLGLAFLIISVVMISLVRSGGALKPAGVIKPAPIGADPTLIGKQIAVRLFPDFHAAQFVVWHIETGSKVLEDIPRTVLENFRLPTKPKIYDLRLENTENCEENCWFVTDLESSIPDKVLQKIKEAHTVDIFVQHFNRDESVPQACETEKILNVKCMKPISVREVRRKLKTSAPYFFMQRYLQSQFYLFVEKSN